MKSKQHTGNAVIAVERRRLITKAIQQHGSVFVAELAKSLGTGLNTIRNDLEILQSDGVLVRIHGGAVLPKTSIPRPSYSETKNEFIDQKKRIAAAALSFISDSGTIFIGSGSTTYQMAVLMKASSMNSIVTNSIDIAAHLVSSDIAPVDFIGGRINKEALASDGSLSDEVYDVLYWESAFMGAAAIDIERGITTLDRNSAKWERRLLENSNKVIVLCDSSKLGKFSYGRVGPVTMIDILITDSDADKVFVDKITKKGVKVIIV